MTEGPDDTAPSDPGVVEPVVDVPVVDVPVAPEPIQTLIPFGDAPVPPPPVFAPVIPASAKHEPPAEVGVVADQAPVAPSEPSAAVGDPLTDAVDIEAGEGQAAEAVAPAEILPTAGAADALTEELTALGAGTAEGVGLTAPASHKAAARRRWPWVVLLVVLAAVVVSVAGVLWYLSTLIGNAMAIDQPGEPFPLTILTADGGAISYSEGLSDEPEAPLMGVATIEGGYVQTSDPVTVGTGEVATTTRVIDKQVLAPPPAVSEPATLDSWFFPHDPKAGLGVDFESVTYDAPLGATPAWFIPGTKDTWVVFMHGRGAAPREGLRIASTVTKLGFPMLLINYRDDANSPAEDGLGNFGQTEEPDLEAAVQYALDNGAKQVVLAGASMGGATELAFLENSPLATSVVGAFLDSPASDLGRMVRRGAADMGVPDFVTSAAMQVAAWRFGIDWAAVDYTRKAGSLSTPILVVQGSKDDRVPASVNEALAAAAAAGTVRYEVFPDAAHMESWNVDRARYDTLLAGFLAKVAP